MPYFSHHFDAVIERHPVGAYDYTVVFLPAEIAAELPFAESSRLRMEADVSGLQVKAAWQPASGRWYVMLPKGPLKEAGLAVGSHVEVSFRLVPQDHVDVPPELVDRLASEPTMQAAWQALTAGKQRAFAHMVGGAKMASTRAARVDAVQAMLLGDAPLPWIMSKRRPAQSADAPGEPDGTEHAQQSKDPLATLPNLGARSAAMLQAAGITTLKQLKALGSVRAFSKVKQTQPKASLNLLWALEGALSGLRWQDVAKEHRASLLLALDTHEQQTRRTSTRAPKNPGKPQRRPSPA
jgi:hypothetical protein